MNKDHRNITPVKLEESSRSGCSFHLYIFMRTHTREARARARNLSINPSGLARARVHARTNETCTKYLLFISLSSMAAPSVRKGGIGVL